MVTLVGLGVRGGLHPSSGRSFRAPHGRTYPGAVAGLDLLEPAAQSVTEEMLRDADLAFAWLDSRSEHDPLLHRDVLLARLVGTPVTLGIAEEYTGNWQILGQICDSYVRADTPEESILKMRRKAIHQTYLNSDPTPPEKVFWEKALKETSLDGLVPEYELRFPSEHGRAMVRRFDFALPAKRLLIEIDGTGHFDATADSNDRLKTELAEKHGYSIVRFRSVPLMRDLEARVAELVERVERTPDRMEADHELTPRVLPTATLDGWPFGTPRSAGRPCTDPEAVTLGFWPGTVLADLTEQRSVLASVADRYRLDFDSLQRWLDESRLGDTFEVPVKSGAATGRRLFIANSLCFQPNLACAVAADSTIPRHDETSSFVIDVDVSESWEQQCPPELWSGLRRILPVTNEQLNALFRAPEGSMTEPVRTTYGPDRWVSLRAAGRFDRDAMQEVARWWREPLNEPVRKLRLAVEPGRGSLRKALGVDLRERFPHIRRVEAWYKGEDAEPVVWSTERPLVHVTFHFDDWTDKELARLLSL